MTNEMIAALVWFLGMAAFLVIGCLCEAKKENNRLKKELEERGEDNV